MVDKSTILERLDQFAAKIAQTNHAMFNLRRRQQHAMKRHVAPRHHDAHQLIHQIAEVRREISIVTTVSHIARAIAVRVQRRKRRGENRIADAVRRQSFDYLNAVAVIHSPIRADGLINAVQCAASKNCGMRTRCAALYSFDSRRDPSTAARTASFVSALNCSNMASASRSLR